MKFLLIFTLFSFQLFAGDCLDGKLKSIHSDINKEVCDEKLLEKSDDQLMLEISKRFIALKNKDSKLHLRG